MQLVAKDTRLCWV